jgi:hypothetical protein
VLTKVARVPPSCSLSGLVRVVKLVGLIVKLVGLTGLTGLIVKLVSLTSPVDSDGVGLLLVAAVSGFLIDVGLGPPFPAAQQRASQLLGQFWLT